MATKRKDTIEFLELLRSARSARAEAVIVVLVYSFGEKKKEGLSRKCRNGKQDEGIMETNRPSNLRESK